MESFFLSLGLGSNLANVLVLPSLIPMGILWVLPVVVYSLTNERATICRDV